MSYLKIKKIFSQTLFSTLVLSILFSVFEPDILGAQTATDTVRVTLTVTSGISITSPVDVTMTALDMSTNTSVASTTWNVKTNDYSGYTLTVRASTSPAMKNATTSIADYTPASANTPEVWSVTNAVEFGFSATGTDVSTGTWGTGAGCNTGIVPLATKKWLNFATTASPTVATRAATTTAGVNTVVCFAAEQNGVYAPAGVYVADITATATAL